MAKTRLVAEVTTANNITSVIDMTTDTWAYEADLAKLREIYGEQNVKEIK